MVLSLAVSRFGIQPKRFSLAALFLAAAAVSGLLSLSAQAADATVASSSTSIITGSVTQRTTGNGLEGAVVTVTQLRLRTLVDNTGRYVLNGVPAGTYEVAVSYTGLDESKAAVTVGAGQRVSQNFELTSGIAQLDAFKVAGEVEGYAAAITAQRNANNVKNVVSMDAYGNLPNLNATELVMRLPGVTFSDPGEEVVEGISIRGQGLGSNTITIDGGVMASYSAQNRQTA